ncbi:hypothetical protein Acaty_c1630 [Acidithiobacillus caldus ATCC 51756]|uniref:Uncharacterized protein n=1 Tax=Acidithiobacillus caldus (strain ATCC 51756 / DSM 8584 / KU) TaxID=637389 RepID=A0A059ZRI8_ACICK|nr:hypothetical protein Acaty_c1630 [Acidithiobacillus caldus ATCC 51756]
MDAFRVKPRAGRFFADFAPLVEGVLHRLEEIIQGKRGPCIWQTYRDI